MALSEKQRKHLRRLGHDLKPVILVGDAGASEGVIRECDLALEHHELVKAKVHGADREVRDAVIDTLAEATGAEVVQRIGHVALLYRRHPEKPRIVV
ncbi:ribosome assembly RNA-binding protein YhbY [Lentisalinibacter orientalis]|uniref:ribosome assembly RNA-binding protein YhbY n=1 Tax=Lentisalinibacter orientalis TaxID=2992241 RepID=UPI00386C1F95